MPPDEEKSHTAYSIELAVSDPSQLSPLRDWLRSQPGIHVVVIPDIPGLGELGLLAVLHVTGGSWLVRAIRTLPDFIRSRRSGLRIKITVSGQSFVLDATGVEEVMPLLEPLLVAAATSPSSAPASRIVPDDPRTHRAPINHPRTHAVRNDHPRSRAVLLGAWDYNHLPPLPAARNSLDRMAGLLTSPICGWPTERVEVLGNIQQRDRLPDRLMELFDGVTDVALFYFVGHGRWHGGELVLALGDSPVAGPRRLTTGLPFSDVRAALRACDAQTKIVILDCFFSGMAAPSAMGRAAGPWDVLDATHGTGAFTMVASSTYQRAWFATNPNTANPQTYFTKYLIDTIERELPTHPEGLSLGRVFTLTSGALALDGLPTPARFSPHETDGFVLARKAIKRTADRPPARVTSAPATTASPPGTAPRRGLTVSRLQPVVLVLLVALLVVWTRTDLTARGASSFFMAALPWVVFVLGFAVLGWQVRAAVLKRGAQAGAPGWRLFTRSFTPPARWSQEEQEARRAAAEQAIDEALLKVDQRLASTAPRGDGETDV